MQDDLLKATTPTDITTVPPAQRAALVLESTKAEAQLRELVSQSVDITEVKDKAGREQAHRAGMTLKNARVGIEKIGKAAREDAKNFSNAVIAEEKRLVAIVEHEEARIFGLRDGYDAAEAARKAELERIEAERVRGIKAKIEQIKNLPHACLQDSAAELAATIADLQGLTPAVADFAEFVTEAESVRLVVIGSMEALHSAAVLREEAAVRLAAERAEMEKQRAEQEERERVAAETKRQLEAQQAAIAEERRKAEAEMQAQREALERERAAFQAQQANAAAAALAAEEERKAAEQKTAEPAQDARSEHQTIGADLAAGPDTTEALVMINAEDGTSLGAVKVTDIAESDASEDEKQAAMARRCLEVGISELSNSTADDKDLVDGFTIMVAGLYETRSADAIRELLDSVLVALEGKKVAA